MQKKVGGTHNHEHHMPKAKVKAIAERHTEGIDLTVPPSGTGCVECLETGGWWLHLNRCAQCGHVGCCDSSPNRHARRHFHETNHPIIQSFEPVTPDFPFGQTFFDFHSNQDRPDLAGVKLMEPTAHPADQPVPGGNLPAEIYSNM